MIPVCFKQEVFLHGENGKQMKLLACEEAISSGGPFPIDRVYLVLHEMLEQMSRDCKNSNIPRPVQLDSSIMSSPHAPKRLNDLLGSESIALQKNMRICLFNGGGGGLGDAIMFAPALKILAKLLQNFGVEKCRLESFSMLPGRTEVIFKGLDEVAVHPLPLTLKEFFEYDAFVDFSGMLNDEVFQTSHMTDFALSRMGINPKTIDDSQKSPSLALPEEPALGLSRVVADARHRSAGKPLVAVIFRSAYARTMPDSKAAAICEALADNYQPVVLMSSVEDAHVFTVQNVLSRSVIDLSEHSTDYLRYMLLLSEMDAIVSVDTSAVHVGGALAIPTVGIFNSINYAYRTKYSPSVAALQIQYSGRSCLAPCGLSKIKSFVQGKLKSGKQFRLEFGHACDEAIDKEKLLDEVLTQISEFDRLGAGEEKLAEIQTLALPKFSEPPAPCWENLQVNEVLVMLKEVFAWNKPK